MFAFIASTNNEKIMHFEEALQNLFHIKYYYLEAIYHYCIFLQNENEVEFRIKLEEGLELSKQFYYQYLFYLFSNLENNSNIPYLCKYDFYPNPSLEKYVLEHNSRWEDFFKSIDLD